MRLAPRSWGNDPETLELFCAQHAHGAQVKARHSKIFDSRVVYNPIRHCSPSTRSVSKVHLATLHGLRFGTGRASLGGEEGRIPEVFWRRFQGQVYIWDISSMELYMLYLVYICIYICLS